MEKVMNKNYRNAAQQLHKFVSGDCDLTDADVRESLKSEGVDIESFLARLAREAGVPAEQPKAKQPTASEKLRALANRAGSGVKKLLGEATVGEFGAPAGAFGRAGKGRRKKSRPHTKG